ncbi:MAG: aldehyde dehydrogenase family protein, partial [Planococcus sp. (in: Bacteria)]|nr:aldehyde dehydrogenase family protein [Planococcus sp. (in: firmicutes)]
MQQHQLYINGTYTDSTGTEWIDIINPSTEETISQIPKGTKEDVDRAVNAAFEAQKAWELMPNIERGKIVRALGDKIAEKRDVFIDLLQEEQG